MSARFLCKHVTPERVQCYITNIVTLPTGVGHITASCHWASVCCLPQVVCIDRILFPYLI